MEKDQILESVQNGKPNNELEDKNYFVGTFLGFLVSHAAALLMFGLEYIFTGRSNLGILFIPNIAGSTQFLYKGIKNNQTKSLIWGIVELLVSLCSVVYYILEMVHFI